MAVQDGGPGWAENTWYSSRPRPPAPTFNVGHECAAFGPCANIEGGGAGGRTILRTTYGHIIAFT